MTAAGPIRFATRKEWREARRPVMDRIEANARASLKPGDRLRVSRCGGMTINVRMSGWDGHWITSAKYNDIAPCAIDRVNGKPISFVDDADRELFEAPMPTIEDRAPRVRFIPWQNVIEITALRGDAVACTILPSDVVPLLSHLLAALFEAQSYQPRPSSNDDPDDLDFDVPF